MAMYGYVRLCRAMYGYVGLCMAVYGCVGLCRAMLGYVGLCKAIERNVFHILANGEPLYDAYTTYLAINHDELTYEPAIWSCDTGQWLSCFDSCQLTIL